MTQHFAVGLLCSTLRNTLLLVCYALRNTLLLVCSALRNNLLLVCSALHCATLCCWSALLNATLCCWFPLLYTIHLRILTTRQQTQLFDSQFLLHQISNVHFERNAPIHKALSVRQTAVLNTSRTFSRRHQTLRFPADNFGLTSSFII